MRCTRAGERARRAALVVGSLLVAGVVVAPPAAAEVRDINRFACPPGLTTAFTDIGGTTHEAAIECAVHYELTGGTSATTFSPSGTVSRAQMATFIANLLGFTDIAPGEFEDPGFTDIEGSAHEGSIEAIVALGIAQGTSATTFSPGAAVSRSQMATFIANTLDFLGVPVSPAGPDAFDDDDGLPNEPLIQAIADDGIAGGTAPRTYDPTGTVSRGAMASFLVRAVDLGIEHAAIVPFLTSESFAALRGADEVPAAGDPDGSGTAYVATTDVPGVVCVGVDVTAIATPTAAHIHQAAPGAAGPIVVTLPTPALDQGRVSCVSDPDAAAILNDPGAFYVNVHNAEFPDGAVRGQLGEMGSAFGAELTDVEVVPGPGDPNALGTFFGFTTSQPGVLCGSLLALSEDTVTGAHLHQGAPHANGPEVMALDPVTDEDLSSPVPTLAVQCVHSDLADDVAADPAAFYADAHSASFPGGALRGQLQPAAGLTAGALVRR